MSDALLRESKLSHMEVKWFYMGFKWPYIEVKWLYMEFKLPCMDIQSDITTKQQEKETWPNSKTSEWDLRKFIKINLWNIFFIRTELFPALTDWSHRQKINNFFYKNIGIQKAIKIAQSFFISN